MRLGRVAETWLDRGKAPTRTHEHSLILDRIRSQESRGYAENFPRIRGEAFKIALGHLYYSACPIVSPFGCAIRANSDEMKFGRPPDVGFKQLQNGRSFGIGIKSSSCAKSLRAWVCSIASAKPARIGRVSAGYGHSD